MLLGRPDRRVQNLDLARLSGLRNFQKNRCDTSGVMTQHPRYLEDRAAIF